jgi:hypothetical protein
VRWSLLRSLGLAFIRGWWGSRDGVRSLGILDRGVMGEIDDTWWRLTSSLQQSLTGTPASTPQRFDKTSISENPLPEDGDGDLSYVPLSIHFKFLAS